MTEEFTTSTPAENVSSDTSVTKPANTDTSITEPSDTNPTAEGGNDTDQEGNTQEVLYAGKYKTVNDLEKGYTELQKLNGQKNSEYETRIKELEAQIQKQVNDKTQQNQELAKSKGFNSYDEFNIDNQVKLKEFEYLAHNFVDAVNPEYQDIAKQALLAYYQTADARYLNEAKKYFNPDVLEKCSVLKNDLKNQLSSELQARKKAEFNARQNEFIKSLDNNEVNKEFLADLNGDTAKQDALKVFFYNGLIQSQEDFNVFKELYKAVEEQGYKKGLAKQQAEEALKNEQTKASFSSGQTVPTYSEGKKLTLANIEKMSQKEYNRYVEKYGLEAILQAE